MLLQPSRLRNSCHQCYSQMLVAVWHCAEQQIIAVHVGWCPGYTVQSSAGRRCQALLQRSSVQQCYVSFVSIESQVSSVYQASNVYQVCI